MGAWSLSDELQDVRQSQSDCFLRYRYASAQLQSASAMPNWTNTSFKRTPRRSAINPNRPVPTSRMSLYRCRRLI